MQKNNQNEQIFIALVTSILKWPLRFPASWCTRPV